MSRSIRKKLVRKLGVLARVRKSRLQPARKKTPLAPGKPPADSLQNLLLAAGFAARKHHGQTRADNQTPYFSHVARVALVLSHVFKVDDDEVLTAALLHDTLEDTATDYDELASLFGERVADYVVLLTKNVMLPKKAREEDYLRRLTDAPEPVMIAKMADLYDNLSARVHSPKLRKTAATAQRLLQVFSRRLETRVGRSAHEKLTRLLEEVNATKFPDAAPETPEPVE